MGKKVVGCNYHPDKAEVAEMKVAEIRRRMAGARKAVEDELLLQMHGYAKAKNITAELEVKP